MGASGRILRLFRLLFIIFSVLSLAANCSKPAAEKAAGGAVGAAASVPQSLGGGGLGGGCVFRLGCSAESADAWKLLSETLCHARTSKQAAAAEGCTSAATLATLETLHRLWRWTHTHACTAPPPPTAPA